MTKPGETRVGANGKKKYNIQPDQLCWNCKRCTNPDRLPCPWAADGVPVEGWVATPGREYFHTYSYDGTKSKSMGITYSISECPLFIKDKPFETYPEAVEYISEKVGVCSRTVLSNIEYYIKKFELVTGEKLPFWVKAHARERKKIFAISKNHVKTLDKAVKK